MWKLDLNTRGWARVSFLTRTNEGPNKGCRGTAGRGVFGTTVWKAWIPEEVIYFRSIEIQLKHGASTREDVPFLPGS